jgi:hypothetical protein
VRYRRQTSLYEIAKKLFISLSHFLVLPSVRYFWRKLFNGLTQAKPGRANKFAPVQDRTALQIRVCTSIGKIVCNKFSFFCKVLVWSVSALAFRVRLLLPMSFGLRKICKGQWTIPASRQTDILFASLPLEKTIASRQVSPSSFRNKLQKVHHKHKKWVCRFYKFM